MTAQALSALRTAFSQGRHWIWLTGAALSVCLLMIVGLLLVVVWNGMGAFWPHALSEANLPEGGKILGAITQREQVFRDGTLRQRTQFKVANRDLYGIDFRWVEDEELGSRRQPAQAMALERTEYGDFYGYLVAVKKDGQVIGDGERAWPVLSASLPEARQWARRVQRIHKHQIGKINYELQEQAMAIKRLEQRLPPDPERAQATARREQTIQGLKDRFDSLLASAAQAQTESQRLVALVRTVDDQEKEIPLASIVRAFQPNQMPWLAKAGHYLAKAWEFVSTEPRESNTEGGILPAIFGTVLMTLLMSVAVVPFGVLAAFYLREYAKQGAFVRAVRVAVNNLAGVPSIVFGVFGLGFFVYFVGGSIDQFLFPERFPQPTYGTGGILWASLTLALLTVPVVIVATEESIAAVPRGAKEGSLALGASKFQTICRVVLPASLPGILTGLILAVARGAGEVAPLMITGVVKLAPSLPLDGQFPYVHLERKFMHLGFHIYDVGFQSPNVEAAKPMVFTTALLLLLVVATLNLAAIAIRERIRRRYRTGAFA